MRGAWGVDRAIGVMSRLRTVPTVLGEMSSRWERTLLYLSIAAALVLAATVAATALLQMLAHVSPAGTG